jgi:hypothetical protein
MDDDRSGPGAVDSLTHFSEMICLPLHLPPSRKSWPNFAKSIARALRATWLSSKPSVKQDQPSERWCDPA